MVKKLKDPRPDDQLFRQEMTGVVPLRTAPTTDSKAPRRAQRISMPVVKSSEPALSHLPASDDHTHINSDDGASHRKNGIQIRTLQKLKRGRFKIGAELDLHNMTVEAAYPVLLAFIADARSRSLESIRVIHGKGLRSNSAPRLKLMTRQVLRDHPQVLAYTTCKPANGGDGAVDILLKSSW